MMHQDPGSHRRQRRAPRSRRRGDSGLGERRFDRLPSILALELHAHPSHLSPRAHAQARRGARDHGVVERVGSLELADAAMRLGLEVHHVRFELALDALGEAMRGRLAATNRRFSPLAAGLKQLSPLRVLERGYAIATDEEGSVLRDPAQTGEGREIGVRLARGNIRARVTR